MAKTIFIFGEVLADVFPDQIIIGGAPYNVARHLHAFGFDPVMLTKIGLDAYGEKILQEMAASGLATVGVQQDQRYPTGQVKVTFTPQGHRFEILNHQAYDFLEADPLLSMLNANVPTMLYLGSLALRNAQTFAAAKKLVEKIGCPIFCDINLRAPWYSAEVIDWLLKIADTLKINREELAEIAPMLDIHASELAGQAKALQQKFQLEHLLVTHGEAGSWWLAPTGEQLRSEAATLEKPFIDSVGAGDAYSAVVMMGLLRGWNHNTILQRASALAAAICSVRGAAPADQSFYIPFQQAWL